MRIHIGSHTIGSERIMTVTLVGADGDFIDLIDSGSGVTGLLGDLTAQIASHTGLVAERTDDRATAVRYLRRAIEVLEETS